MSLFDRLFQSAFRLIKKFKPRKKRKPKVSKKGKRVNPKSLPSRSLNSRRGKVRHRASGKAKTRKKSGPQRTRVKYSSKKSTSRSSRLRKSVVLKKDVSRTGEKNPTARKRKETPVGIITHYFSRIEVVVIKITKEKLKVGDKIHISGKTTDFIQNVASLQIESVDVKSARTGQLVGLKVEKPAREGDKILRVA